MSFQPWQVRRWRVAVDRLDLELHVVDVEVVRLPSVLLTCQISVVPSSTVGVDPGHVHVVAVDVGRR